VANKRTETIAKALATAILFGDDRAVETCGLTRKQLVSWQKEQLQSPDPEVSDRVLFWQSKLTDHGQIGDRAISTLMLMLDSLRDLSRTPIDDTQVDSIEALSRAAERVHKIALESRDRADVAPAKQELIRQIKTSA